MSFACSELVVALLAACLCLGLSSCDPVLELQSLRSHRQRLLGEIERIYMEQPLGGETQLLLDELQVRDQQLRLQIAQLEAAATVPAEEENSSSSSSSTQRLAINLTADFEHLQHKLDDLKRHLDRLDVRFATQQGKQLDGHTPATSGSSSHPAATAAPSSGIGSFFWTPLLTMPEFPQGSIAATDHGQDHKQQQQHQPQSQQASPSIIKRVLDMLRPSAAGLRNRWLESEKSATGSPSTASKLHVLTAEELLPQLQEQRKFLDAAITRLELLSATKSPKRP
ncbi:uncharacterized protein DMAD_02298 [Drosophila madeirensis]|uniref:Uncharacterized protein n=1 Tax=Drosophila madeirensis TaxID=30013 RepID=A0AAU9G5D0_DROMD